MEKKSSIKEVYKYIDQDLPQLHAKLTLLLGEDHPFAKFNIGAGVYVWSDSRYHWKNMTDADPLVQTLIQDTLSLVKKEVASKVGVKTTERLFTIPDDSYIYYADDNGDIKILLTGWGFKKPVRSFGKRNIEEISKKNKVSISFSYNGTRLRNHDFGLQLPKQLKRLKTDADGLFFFPDLKAGTIYILKDLNNPEKDFQLIVTDGISHYDFDTTESTEIKIKVEEDSKPAPNEDVEILYQGQTYHLTTNQDGNASLRIPFYENEPATASVREKKQTLLLKKDGIEFVFEFKPEIIPPTPPQIEVRIKVIKNGEKAVGESIFIYYGEKEFSGVTDNDGVLSLSLEEVPNHECEVEVQDFDNQYKELVPGIVNEFLFKKEKPILPRKDIIDKPKPPVPPVKEFDEKDKEIRVTFLNSSGQPIKCSTVSFRQFGVDTYTTTLDDMGVTTFSEGKFRADSPLSVDINDWDQHNNPTTFTFLLEKNEYDYILQEKNDTDSTRNNKIWIIGLILGGIIALALWPLLEIIFANIKDSIY